MGGGETTLYDLLTSLDPERFKPHLVLPAEGPLSKKLVEKNVPVYTFPFPRGFFRGYPPGWSWRAFFKMLRLAQTLPAHLIHVNDSYLCLYAGLLGKLLKVPVLLSSHGWWDVHFLHQELMHRLFGYPLLAVSEAVRQSLLKRGWLKKDRVHRVYLGVDTDRFKPGDKESAKRKLGLPPKETTLTISARFIPRKGHDAFFEAAKIILSRQSNIRLLVVGDAIFESFEENKETKQQILNLVEKDPALKSKTLFLGFREDMPEILAATDILISAAWFETFGVAIAEAMASGVPVVSTDVGGPAELVEEGKTGYLVPPKRPDLITDRTLKLIFSPSLREEMGSRGRERAVSLFSLKSYRDCIQKHYQLLL